MIRYLVSLIVLLIGIFLINFFTGGTIPNLLNIYSFMIIGIFPIIFVCILYGIKDTVSAFLILTKNEQNNENLLKALNFFKLFGKITWITGIVAIIIIAVTMLVYLEDRNGLGPNLHTILITLLYCGVINIGVIIPYSTLIKRKILK